MILVEPRLDIFFALNGEFADKKVTRCMLSISRWRTMGQGGMHLQRTETEEYEVLNPTAFVRRLYAKLSTHETTKHAFWRRERREASQYRGKYGWFVHSYEEDDPDELCDMITEYGGRVLGYERYSDRQERFKKRRTEVSNNE